MSFDHVSAFADSLIPDASEFIFLTGQPSAQWLNTIGCRYALDYRFLHQHLGSAMLMGTGRYCLPDLPSRSLDVLHLSIPSIVFIGSHDIDLDVQSLEGARDDMNTQLRHQFRRIQDNLAAEPGRSIFRRFGIYDAHRCALEQDVSVTVVQRGVHWTVMIWNDAGSTADASEVPRPKSKEFASIADHLAFCPVPFESAMVQPKAKEQLSPSCDRQPLASLSGGYGATLEWHSPERHSPLYVVSELLTFYASSVSLYLNMLQDVVAHRVCDFPSYEHTKLEWMVKYEYAKAALGRMCHNLVAVRSFLQAPPNGWVSADEVKSTASTTHAIRASLLVDLESLLARADSLKQACDEGREILMNNASIQDARRSAAEADLVTQLTKATNRLTFIFLPISFVTSVFGMNFRQFGQGSLSIWIWAAVTVPLLVVSVALVERSTWQKQRLSNARKV